ncbi:hypothetical protein [Acidovorax sp.]|uniref:hypothetical protein n=1 Tax=Acidovorax sp. TaxID=1872122 RepID=UPI00260EA2E1|nr:hypothetical protein [Acidovorax sp.]
MSHASNAAPRDEEYSLPCAEALLAGTLALMTGYVQVCCDGHREAMGRKIVNNLEMLGQLESLTPHFRAMLGNLQGRWVLQCQVAGAEAEPTSALTAAEQRRALWVAAPEALQ